ncbi:MAG: hypothetical protein ACFFG0_30615 [Candidatus Thorarchaeota archaeon]
MSDCGWCGQEIKGISKMIITIPTIVTANGKNEVEPMPGYEVKFCCHGCAWAFSAEIHRLMGLSGKDLRNHLIGEHGLKYPHGKPAGVMRRDCMIKVIAESLSSFI